MKSNNGILTEKEIQARTKFWNKKQFRTWSKKELERTSTDMQKLLKLNKVNRINNLLIYLLSLQHQIKNGTPEPIRGQKQ